MKIFRVIQTVW